MSIPYIVRRRARFLSICGPVNLPYGTEVSSDGAFLTANGEKLCSITSQNAYDFFSRNDDGHGLDRGKLVEEITSRMEKRDAKHQARWDALWADEVANHFRRPDHADFWVWGQAFYQADIRDLEHILKLIKEVR